MGYFNSLVKGYSARYNCRIKRVCATLKNCYGISIESFQVNQMLLKLEKQGNDFEGFLFATSGMDSQRGMQLVSLLDALSKFGRYFKREAADLIEAVRSESYILKVAKEEAFDMPDPSLPLFSKDPKSNQLLKAIFPLTVREKECLELFQQGKQLNQPLPFLSFLNAWLSPTSRALKINLAVVQNLNC